MGKLENSALRRAAVVALGELGRSSDPGDRADAGRGLAGFAEMEEAVGPLLKLVLDRENTFVTRVTAEALLRRQDRVGLMVVASALAVASPNHGDWIHTAILDAFAIYASDRDDAMRLCEELTMDPDERVALGARALNESLSGIDCVLHPE
ncbi:hypothetical protein OG594_45275 [Streptomyces sp. NBC_01214]|uniref:hypothetical protein n=1 Tax=Streptomyces sp. NBC_01214 TaxID=2903777 RepID=UPI00224DF0CE|nr:hypothetical protein [Streptomyces sp. NBC_01214]MCX4808699.1 hypothetical protein [Streptomyces sp. NBC_01214]